MATKVMHSPVVVPFRLVSSVFTLSRSTSFMPIITLAQEPIADDPCNPSPCGSNAVCNNGICTCLAEYQGDPYTGCRPECVLNSDCSKDKACLRSKCVNPCTLQACAQNAICEVVSHIPMCRCPPGLEGNALVQCQPVQSMHLLKNLYFHWISVIKLSSFSSSCTKSLPSVTLWSQQSMQRNQWASCMFLCSKLYWKSSNLSTRMYCKLRLSIQRSML